MRIMTIVAALLVLSPLSLALAENQLPTTNIVGSKPKPKPHVVVQPRSYLANPQGGGVMAPDQSILPDRPDPTTPHVRARDWNAPGAINLAYMTDVQFAAFQAAHPNAVFSGRCFVGEDPDPNTRMWVLKRPLKCSE